MTIDKFTKWDQVEDYESDENNVSLLDVDGNVLQEYSYSRFTQEDFNYYKNKFKK